MEKFPNAAGFHDYEDVPRKTTMPFRRMTKLITASMMPGAHEIDIPTRASLGMDRNAVRFDMKMAVNAIVAVLAILALLFAMHGDQVALSNGWIH